MLFSEKTLVFSLQVCAEGHGVFKFSAAGIQDFHRLPVGDAYKVLFHKAGQTVSQAGSHKFVEQGHVRFAAFQNMTHHVPDKPFAQFHIVPEIGKSRLGLNHPELGRVRCV